MTIVPPSPHYLDAVKNKLTRDLEQLANVEGGADIVMEVARRFYEQFADEIRAEDPNNALLRMFDPEPWE